MKKILITGKNSYIGSNFKKKINSDYKNLVIDELDVSKSDWVDFNFSGYNTIFHVAGLAHSTPNKKQRDLYYKVNTDLTYNVAVEAKKAGVKQFIFMSSIIVYGSGLIGETRVIDKSTPLEPDNFYGDSKRLAEMKLLEIADETFKVVIIRSPMIYGPASKGNYKLLSSVARKIKIFPNFKNERSMLFIGNLIEFVRLMIENDENGIFVPQNEKYVSTKQLVSEIARIHHNKIIFVNFFNKMICFMNKNKYINKVFGNLVIDLELSDYINNYNLYSFEDSIAITEEGNI